MLELTPQGRAALDRLRATPVQLKAVASKALRVGLQVALGKTQRERFSGRGPFPVSERRLGIVTGRLRNSFLDAARSVAVQESGSEIVAVVGSAVSYFPRHEFGFSGTEQVRQHSRLITRELETGRVVRNVKSARKGKTTATGLITVKAHSRRVNTPARAPLRTGLNEHLLASFAAELERALRAK